MTHSKRSDPRKSGKGFSLRRALELQGVTSESAMREHLNFAYDALQSNPDFDITTYRADPNEPNSGLPAMG